MDRDQVLDEGIDPPADGTFIALGTAEALFGIAAADAVGRPLAECPIAWQKSDVPEQIASHLDAREAKAFAEFTRRSRCWSPIPFWRGR